MSRLRGGLGQERITATAEIWRDPARPAAERVADLLGRMTLEEKVAQLTSIWVGDQPRDGNVASMQDDMSAIPPPLAELIRDGLGQVTRVFGTRPLPPAAALSTLRELQAQIAGASRFGIPAIAHEECLTGFAAWTATVFPTPLAWGASFDPELVHEMAGAIGQRSDRVGPAGHQHQHDRLAGGDQNAQQVLLHARQPQVGDVAALAGGAPAEQAGLVPEHGRAARRGRAGVLPRRGGRPGDRRGIVRPGGAQRPAAGGAAQAAGRPAVFVPALAAGRPPSG